MAQLLFLSSAASAGLVLCWLLFRIVQIGFLTRLRTIPGPWHARFCNWGLKLATLSGVRIHYIHRLHQIYGPIVRVAPNEIAINDAQCFKEIHRVGGGFLKTRWYREMGLAGVNRPGIFGMTNPKQHAIRRKLLARGFDQRYLRKQWEDIVSEKVDLAVARIKSDAKTPTGADVLRWWTYLAIDVSANLMFGESFKTLETGTRLPYIEALEHVMMVIGMKWELPLVYHLGRMLSPYVPSLGTVFRAGDVLAKQGTLAIKNSKAQGYKSSNIFATAINEAEKDDGTMTDEEVSTEASNLIVAGSDTTGNTLAYLTWAVLKQPDLQRSLEQEIDQAQLRGPLTDAALETLPILSAVIEETLRLYGAAPGTLPRDVPKGGMIFQDHFIPEGTIVGTQSWSLHRDPSLFPDPDK